MPVGMGFTRVVRSTRELGASVVDFLYPSSCCVCKSAMDFAGRWCEKCEKELAKLQFAPACKVCAMPLSEYLAPCPYCEGKGLRPFEKIARLGIFASPLKELIHFIKYRHDWPLAERIGARLADHDQAAEILKSADVVVPVPLHWMRHVGRGFNQAEVVACAMGRRHGVKVRRAVVRLRGTPTQTALHKRAKRLENLANAFGVVNPSAVRGKRVVLVDDVITTAATLQTLAREIRRHEPASISAIVLAIADPKGRAFETI